MSEHHKYSIGEIDQMRSLIGWLLPWGQFSMPMSERFANVEQVLRTHMLNGTTVDELRTALNEAEKSRQKLRPIR